MEFGPHLILAVLEGSLTAAVIALTAVGLSIVFGIMRVVNVAHGEFFMLGAVVSWYIVTLVGIHPALGFFIALAVTPILIGIVAVVANQLVLVRLEYHPERTIVATIGLLYIIQQVTLMTFGPDARPVVPPFNHRIALPWLEFSAGRLEIYWPWGFGTTTYRLAVIAASIATLSGLWLFLAKTRFGLIMRATQLDREMAQAFGIPVNRVYAYVFGIGAALAAFGAVLIVPIRQAHYLMGAEPLLLSFIVVIIGGLGSIPGTILAAILIGLSDGIISVFFSPTLAKIIATLVVAFVLVFRPQGLFGKVLQ